MADQAQMGQQLEVDDDGNITTLAPSPPEAPERVAPDIDLAPADPDTPTEGDPE